MNHDRHDHGHDDHAHAPRGARGRLAAGLALTLGFAVVEAVGGWLSHSLALIADAVHMLADAGALTLALVAAAIAARPHTDRATYGFHRAEVLAALANAAILGLLLTRIAWEAIARLAGHASEPIEGRTMLLIAVLGLVVNLVVLAVLRGGHAGHDNLNLRAAAIHVIGDLAGSVAAIAAAALVLWRGWWFADPLAGLAVSALIGWSAWRILREAAEVLLDVAPAGADAAAIGDALLGVPGITGVHDLHVWTIVPGRVALSAHVHGARDADPREILAAAERLLGERFAIHHTTIQVEPAVGLPSTQRLPRHPGP